MTFKEHIKIGRRGLKLLYSLSHRYLLSMILHSIVTAVTPYVSIYFSARLVDGLSTGAEGRNLAVYAGLTVGLTAVFGLLGAFLKMEKEVGFQEVLCNHDWLHADKSMKLSYASIEDQKVSILREQVMVASRTGYNLFYLTVCIEQYVIYGVRILASLSLTVSFFAGRGVAVWEKLLFVGGVLLTLVLSVLVNQRSARLQMAYYSGCTAENLRLEKMNNYLNRYETGKDIRIYGMAKPLGDFERSWSIGGLYTKERKMRYQCAGLNFLVTVMEFLLRFAFYLVLIHAVLGGGLSVGSIAQYVSCIFLLLKAVSGVVRTVQISLVNHEYLRAFFSYFDIPNPMYQGSLSVEKREDNDYSIEFRDVSFRYPGREEYALRHVNLKFRIGERLAVVGMNGSGKTTFIKLLCRMYDPTEGEILLNGVDIRKYDYEEYMALFSVVFQDFWLFAFPLGENVAAGAEYDGAKVENCLKEAGFDRRLSEMPEGLKTCLYHDYEEKGVEISGGEAQKIAIARALYKNAPFIVLDEPTAALDPVSEYEVYQKFNEISGGKTAIYISHRLASCRFCDDILVFSEGRIVQHGVHEELLAQEDGKYAALWKAQAQYYTEEGKQQDN